MTAKIKRSPFLLLMALLCMVRLMGNAASASAAETAQTGKPSLAQTDFRSLEGRWLRPDGGYILELKNIRKDGSASAAYFNPRPIRVFRTKVSRNITGISLVVELRDINYPGSTYTLQYDPALDRLKGIYYQAVMRQTFGVEFVRLK